MSWRIDLVRELFELFDTEGVDAVLARTPADVVWTPLGAEGRSYVGPEVREYFAAQQRSLSTQSQHLFDLEERGEAVLVSGSVQVRSRETRVDFQPTWVYEFEGDRLCRATGHPTRQAALQHLGAAADEPAGEHAG